MFLRDRIEIAMFLHLRNLSNMLWIKLDSESNSKPQSEAHGLEHSSIEMDFTSIQPDISKWSLKQTTRTTTELNESKTKLRVHDFYLQLSLQYLSFILSTFVEITFNKYHLLMIDSCWSFIQETYKFRIFKNRSIFFEKTSTKLFCWIFQHFNFEISIYIFSVKFSNKSDSNFVKNYHPNFFKLSNKQTNKRS